MTEGKVSEGRMIASSGQWCELHGCHQDDPAHAYEYPLCERHLRDATSDEEQALQPQPCKRCGGHGYIVLPQSREDIRVGESRRWHEPCPVCGTGTEPEGGGEG